MLERVKDVQRQAAAAPKADDFARECGATVTDKGGGEWEAVVTGEENIRRAVAMQNGSRKIAIERGAKLDASREKERLVDGEGRAFDAPVHLAEQIAKKRGMRAKPRWGRPSYRYVARGGELVRVI